MKKQKTIQFIGAVATLLPLVLSLSACGDMSTLEPRANSELSQDEAESLGQDFGTKDRRDIVIDDGAEISAAAKPYCSGLSFSGVTWNKALTPYERRSLSIGLSLSGSFEGANGWKNLTNNFDGQGLSAGLLNQTLGTNSLQPLLANLKQRNLEAFQDLGSTRRTSMLDMISTWESARGYKVPSSLSAKLIQTEDENVTSSSLDIPEDPFHLGFSTKIEVMATPASVSVSWAKANLYTSSGAFKPEWRTELANLMGHPAYVSEQISASEVLHRRASGYLTRLGFSSLRAYLLMFDVCVQNGGFNESEFVELETAVKNERLDSETTILKRLIEIRLRRTLPQWRADVRSRKLAIIDGVGKVHGANRNFPKQYCYAQLDPIK